MNGSYNLDDAFRNASTTFRVVPLTLNADTIVAARSRSRIAIRFWSALTAYLSTDAMTAISQGITFNSSSPTYQFTQRNDGDFATNEFHAYTGAGGAVMIVEEVFACPCATGH